MTRTPDNDNDHDSIYDGWLDERREPPDLRLDESVMGWLAESSMLDEREPSNATLLPASSGRFRRAALQVAHAAIVAAAVVICVTRVCLVIFPFSELH